MADWDYEDDEELEDDGADMLNTDCDVCFIGKYQKTLDKDILVCDNCGHRISRYGDY